MEVIFREMEYDDLEKVINLCNRCFDENTNLEYAKKIYKENEYDPREIYLVGVSDDKIIAHLRINVIPTIYENMSTYAILNHVCVDPDYRRHHLGSALLDVAFKICQEKGCSCVELWSMNFRGPAHKLYHKYGFVPLDCKFFKKEIVVKE